MYWLLYVPDNSQTTTIVQSSLSLSLSLFVSPLAHTTADRSQCLSVCNSFHHSSLYALLLLTGEIKHNTYITFISGTTPVADITIKRLFSKTLISSQVQDNSCWLHNTPHFHFRLLVNLRQSCMAGLREWPGCLRYSRWAATRAAS